MASFHTTLLCKEYTSYCCCARVGRSKHCVCGEDDMDFCWTWDPDSTHTDTSVQVCLNLFLPRCYKESLVCQCIDVFDLDLCFSNE